MRALYGKCGDEPPLHAGVDTSVSALIGIMERALAHTTPVGVKPGRYRPADALLAFLERL